MEVAVPGKFFKVIVGLRWPKGRLTHDSPHNGLERKGPPRHREPCQCHGIRGIGGKCRNRVCLWFEICAKKKLLLRLETQNCCVSSRIISVRKLPRGNIYESPSKVPRLPQTQTTAALGWWVEKRRKLIMPLCIGAKWIWWIILGKSCWGYQLMDRLAV